MEVMRTDVQFICLIAVHVSTINLLICRIILNNLIIASCIQLILANNLLKHNK